jgi:hypothetical protein
VARRVVGARWPVGARRVVAAPVAPVVGAVVAADVVAAWRVAALGRGVRVEERGERVPGVAAPGGGRGAVVRRDGARGLGAVGGHHRIEGVGPAARYWAALAWTMRT